ncbi:hypothetical protein M8J75_013121 [Diaphorina citri]|nr:hypothetical protein M8J75_013121 [Diaphorina citri]
METLDLERAEFVLDRTPADKKKVDLAMIWMLEQMAKLQEMAFLMDETIVFRNRRHFVLTHPSSSYSFVHFR